MTFMEVNHEMELAWDFIEQTGTNIFLTGKAGTGKTTFLRRLKERSPKRMVVVAPTGVAAINAGGVTIHSFFQIPTSPFTGISGGESKRFFRGDKLKIIRSLDLLVIDEISMVRADMLDAVDEVLRRYRDRSKPFGGVQLLMIGDLQQLPPVVTDSERAFLDAQYSSPFFFDSRALRGTHYVTIELKHIYRQRELDFVEILNRVRDNNVDAATLARLNSRYMPDFSPGEKDGYIILTSHNHSSRLVNDHKLSALRTKERIYKAVVEGDFSDKNYPTERDLLLKIDAQVMFLKNDTSGQQRYYNGKIGRVTALNETSVEVSFEDGSSSVSVDAAEWTNVKYALDTQTREIREKVEGVFRQIPLRTAWAITIHKSQGLTFERAIIDAADSFSHGQVYVALSRCRSFEGVVLRTPLPPSAIKVDYNVLGYNKNIEENQPTKEQLTQQSRAYYHSLLLDMFDFGLLLTAIEKVEMFFHDNMFRVYPRLTEQWADVKRRFDQEVYCVGERFKSQISSIVSNSFDVTNDALLRERLEKGQEYFRGKLDEIASVMIVPGQLEIDNKEHKKQYALFWGQFLEQMSVKLAVLRLDNSDGFSVSSYLEARSKAAVGEIAAKISVTTKAKKPSVPAEPSPSDADIKYPELFEILRDWRNEVAKEQKIPSFMIMHYKALIGLANKLPISEREILDVKGVGKAFVSKYGKQVLAIVDDWANGKI